MKVTKGMLRMVVCLVLGVMLGCSSMAFADFGEPGYLMETQADIRH